MDKKLFPSDSGELKCVEFCAEGFTEPVAGVIYRTASEPCCGVPLGGIGTGCLDVQASGVLGFNTIFNAYPRNPQLLLPFLGLAVGRKGDVYVLAKQDILNGGTVQGCTRLWNDPENWVVQLRRIEGVHGAKEIHYFGHYPIADLEYETDAPMSVGLRAWSPFIPGDIGASSIPGAIFEVHLRNTTGTPQQGTIAFSFPGPTKEEIGDNGIQWQEIHEEFNGLTMTTKEGVGYALGVIGEGNPRFGGDLATERPGWSHWERPWARIGSREETGGLTPALPPHQPGDRGASIAVDFDLKEGEDKTIRFVLAWYARGWQGEGMNRYHHMYAMRYRSALDVARRLARDHASLLKRILGWQQAIYTSRELPVWLRDALVNNLCLIAEDSLWAQPRPPLGDWCYPEGLFVLDECPRGCPQIECIPCSWLGNLPIVYFYPQLARTTLRGYKKHQREDGAAPFDFGLPGTMGLVSPCWEWQKSLNGVCFVDMVDRVWRRTGDDSVLREFYPAVKKSTICTANLRPGPEGLISMPEGNVGCEWWETKERGEWFGMCTHLGGLHLSNFRIAERMADNIGDKEFATQCREWFNRGSTAMEEKMWNEATQSYLLYNEPETGRMSDDIMSNQLDGQWANRLHGLEGVFRSDRVRKVLAKIKQTCLVEKGGAVCFADARGNPDLTGYGIFPPETYILAMTYMYEGDKETGLEILRRSVHNLVVSHPHPWDLPNMIRCDTGERTSGTDYYQNMMLWAVPAALQGQDLSELCKPGGLVGRILKAGSED